MKYTITGSNLQIANVEIDANEEMLASSGAMVYTSGNVSMEAQATGGLFKGLKRAVAGESFFQVKYKVSGGTGTVGFAAVAPGKIKDLDIGAGSWIVQRTGYLASQPTVNFDIAFQKKLGSVFFGGEGLVLQKLSGKGIAFIHACGDLIEMDLKPGQTIKVSTSNAVAWQDGVKYEITSVGNIKTALFGGEGMFVTTLTGPGKIIIQSMTMNELAMAMYGLMPHDSN